MLKRLFLSFADVDWRRTKAFSVGNFGQVYLNVNTQGRCGTVSPEEYEALRDRIAAEALAFRDPIDGNQIVKRVYKREDLFHGGSISRLPDLVLYTDRARYVSFGHADFGSNQIVDPSIGQTGHHHLTGVLVLKGPGVRHGLTLDKASILDLAPTILNYMGLSIPKHMDGQTLKKAFDDDFNHTNHARYCESALEPLAENTSYNSDEAEAMIEKLRDMGYVA